MSTPRLALLLVAPLVMVGSLPRAASAQWTLPQGQLVVSTGFDFQYADTEFFGQDGEERRERPFPLEGEYFGSTMRFDARVGLTDALELELVVPLRVVSYVSDPVILLPQPMDSIEPSLDYYQRNTLDLSQTSAGLGDVEVAGRYRFLGPPFVLAGELRLKVPGGYPGPVGTFGAEPSSAQGLLDDLGNIVTPQNVSDDVTLGDGQVDLIGRVLAGVAFDTGTFMAGDVGYNARFDDAGHQLLASFRVGQLIENIVLLFAGASFGISVTEGRVIGVSVAAEDPTLPADQYGGLANLALREVRLQRDYLDIYGGVIFRISPAVELKLAYARTAWGRNTAAVNTFTIGVGARTTLFDVAPPAAAAEDDYDEDYDDEGYDDEPAYEGEAAPVAEPAAAPSAAGVEAPAED